MASGETFGDRESFRQLATRLFSDTAQTEAALGSGPDGTALCLEDHPYFGQLTRLAELARAPRTLLPVSMDDAGKAFLWRHRLDNTPCPALLAALRAGEETGYLVVRAPTWVAVVSVCRGHPTNVASDVREDLLPFFLCAAGCISEEQAEQSFTQRGHHLALDLLLSEHLSVDELIDWHIKQAQRRFYRVTTAEQVDVAFTADPGARQVPVALALPWRDLMWWGLAAAGPVRFERLREIVAPLLSAETTLVVSPAGPSLLGELSRFEQALWRMLNDGHTAASLLAAAPPGEQEQAFVRALFLLWRLGLVRAPGQAAVLPEPAGPPPMPAPASARPAGNVHAPDPEAELKALRAREDAERNARRLLHGYRPDAAAAVLADCVERGGASGDVLALLALAMLLRARPGDAAAARAHADRAMEVDPDSPLANAALSRVLHAAGRKGDAEAYRAKAYQLSEGSPGWEADVRTLLTLTAQPPAPKQQGAEATHAVSVWLLAVAVTVALFVLANVAGAGSREYFYSGTDGFFYARRLILLLAGLGGVALLAGGSLRDGLLGLGWRLAPGFVVLGLLYGTLLGSLSPVQRVTGSAAVVCALTFLHVGSEEVFFRGLVVNLVRSATTNRAVVVAASAAWYGLYHLTMQSFWSGTRPLAALYWTVLIALAAGVPYVLLRLRSGSMVPALMCHLAVNLTMMWQSLTANT